MKGLIEQGRGLLEEIRDDTEHRIELTCTKQTIDTLVPLLKELRYLGRVGASRTVRIEDWDDNRRSQFGFDGDGADHIGDIIVDGTKVK